MIHHVHINDRKMRYNKNDYDIEVTKIVQQRI